MHIHDVRHCTVSVVTRYCTGTLYSSKDWYVGSEYIFTIDKGCYLFESIVIHYERGILPNCKQALRHPVSSFDCTLVEPATK